MLFDLRGKRKRVIQVIYAGLALLMGVGLVGFGIGSDASGGIFTCNGNPHSQAAIDLMDRADDVEARLQASPKDEALWLELTRARVQAANAEADVDPQTGAPDYGEEGVAQLQEAADAWESYLELEPKKPNAGVAALVSQAYFSLAQTETDINQGIGDLEAAADAARILTEERPSQGTFAQLAQYLFLSGQFKAAERAAKRSLAEAEATQKSTLEEQFKQYERIGKEIRRQIKQLAQAQPGGGNPLQDPLGGLGSSSGGLTP